jgi:hypothetical protein
LALLSAVAGFGGGVLLLPVFTALFGFALLGSVGPLTAPLFLAYGLTRAAYIGLTIRRERSASAGRLDGTTDPARYSLADRDAWLGEDAEL